MDLTSTQSLGGLFRVLSEGFRVYRFGVSQRPSGFNLCFLEKSTLGVGHVFMSPLQLEIARPTSPSSLLCAVLMPFEDRGEFLGADPP